MSKRRPVIGVTTYTTLASWGSPTQRPAALLPINYVEKVKAVGARPVMLPPDDADADVLDRLDGLILAGGPDIAPELYGEAVAHEQTVVQADRDSGELLLAAAAIERDLPVLGICRGMQVLAVAYGATLHQHLPDLVGHDGHRAPSRDFTPRQVRIVAGSRLAGIIGEEADVLCYHHQAVAEPGALSVTAYAEDGVVEAVEDPGRRFMVGVEWHPEAGTDLRLFQALAAAATG
jgi:putative glutamine amidotransferase